jgi:uncharacterized protein YbjT (DUF2867 family)
MRLRRDFVDIWSYQSPRFALSQGAINSESLSLTLLTACWVHIWDHAGVRSSNSERTMADKLVTVFGGSGFLGRHAVRLLAKAGYRVRVAVRRPHTAHFLQPLGGVGQIELVQANLRDDESVRRALKGADAAINLVGLLYEGGKQSFEAIHAVGAGRVAEMATEEGVKSLVHISAIGASEQATAKYALTKAEGEKRVRAAFPTATILRPSIVFGPEDEFFNRFAGLTRLLPFLPLIGGGHTKFQPVFVGDVAQAILNSLNDNKARGRTFELGGPCVYSFKELLEFILETIDRRRLLINLPFWLAKFEAAFYAWLPKPPLTGDQVELLKSDNIVGESGEDGIGDIANLDVTPTSIEALVPTYLICYRRQGQYDEKRAV